MGFFYTCVCVCVYTHFMCFIYTKNCYGQVQVSDENSRGSNPFHEKSNVFYRNQKCDDGHLTSMTNVMVHGNREKRSFT